MKSFLIFILFPAFLFTGCSTTAYYANGQRAFVTYGNSKTLAFKSGDIVLTADTLNHSTPTSAAFTGINKLAGTVGSAAVAIAIPGSGTAPLIGRAAVSAVPHLTDPKTPAPKSAADIWP